MTREDIVNSMSLEDAIQVFKDTNCYGTMDIAKTVILKALEQEPCEDCVSREQAKAEIRKAFPSLADRVDINSILNELPSVQPKTETVTEFADRCKECGARYGRLLRQEQKTDILDKINEEIKEYCEKNCIDGDIVADELSIIIDKYRQEE